MRVRLFNNEHQFCGMSVALEWAGMEGENTVLFFNGDKCVRFKREDGGWWRWNKLYVKEVDLPLDEVEFIYPISERHIVKIEEAFTGLVYTAVVGGHKYELKPGGYEKVLYIVRFTESIPNDGLTHEERLCPATTDGEYWVW